MFENFLVFTEVVKLSSNVFYQLEEINYHDKVLDFIYDREDVNTFEKVLDLVEDKYLITRFIKFLKDYGLNETEKLWVKNILKVINHINIAAFDNALLIYAFKYEFYESFRYLIQKGADIHVKDNYLLRVSAARGNLDLVKYLVERPDCKICDQQCIHGADIHSKNEGALVTASSYGHLEIVKYLVSKGAKINDCYALWISSRNGYFETVKYLVERPDCKICNQQCIHGAKMSTLTLGLINFGKPPT